MTGTFKVVSQTDPMDITKLDGTITQKSSILLQELGSQYEDTYSCTLLGNGATLKFYPGDIVLASLRFTAHQYQEQFYKEPSSEETSLSVFDCFYGFGLYHLSLESPCN